MRWSRGPESSGPFPTRMNARVDSKHKASAFLPRKAEQWSANHALKKSVGLCGGEAFVTRGSVSGRSAARAGEDEKMGYGS